MKRLTLLFSFALFAITPLFCAAQSNDVDEEEEEEAFEREPSETIELIFTNAFEDDLIAYVGIDNPIRIQLNNTQVGNPANLAIINSSKKKIASVIRNYDGGMFDFIMTPTKAGTTTLTVIEWVGNTQRQVESFSVKVKELPKPKILLGGNDSHGTIMREELFNKEYKLTAVVEDGLTRIAQPKILSFTMAVGTSPYLHTTGNYLSQAMIDLINQSPIGAKIIFNDIVIEMPGGKQMVMNTFFRLN